MRTPPAAHSLYRSGAGWDRCGAKLKMGLKKEMSLGRMLIALGLVVAALGALISLGERLPIRLGRLPGDIIIRGKHSVFYFPLVTCLLISVVLSLVLWLLNRR
jgi:Protein of unknown function (DUF2905)